VPSSSNPRKLKLLSAERIRPATRLDQQSVTEYYYVEAGLGLEPARWAAHDKHATGEVAP